MAWLSQRLMAELFDVDVRTITEHLSNVFSSSELEKEATIRRFRIVRRKGTRNVTRSVEHYNLDAIISVGYRVKISDGHTVLYLGHQAPARILGARGTASTSSGLNSSGSRC